MKRAKERLRQARLDRARAERKVARAEVDRAEAKRAEARAGVAYQAKVVERLKELVDRGAIEPKLVNEQERRLTQARDAEQMAEAALGVARAHVQATEARLWSVEPEARPDPSNPKPEPAPTVPRRR